jgi:hypothetical protein
MNNDPTAWHVLRVHILKAAKDKLGQASSWAKNRHYDYAFAYQEAAKALIELLEVQDCGIVGGWARKTIGGRVLVQHEIPEYCNGLEGRLKWLELVP